MTTAKGQADREELIGVIQDIWNHKDTSVFPHDDAKNKILIGRRSNLGDRIKSILEREPPKLEPCGVCGAKATSVCTMTNQIYCSHSHCHIAMTQSDDTSEDVNKLKERWNAANAAIRAMREKE